MMAPGGAGTSSTESNAEMARLQQQLAEEAEDNEALSKEMVALDSDHQKLTDQSAALGEENTRLREENKRLAAENEELKSKAGAAHSGYAEGRQDVQGLTLQLQEAGDRLESLLEDKEDLEIQCKELELQVTTLEDTLANGGQLIVDPAKASDYGDGIGDAPQLRSRVAQLEQEKERLVDEVEEKEIRNTELLIEIETLEEEILTLVDSNKIH